MDVLGRDCAKTASRKSSLIFSNPITGADDICWRRLAASRRKRTVFAFKDWADFWLSDLLPKKPEKKLDAGSVFTDLEWIVGFDFAWGCRRLCGGRLEDSWGSDAKVRRESPDCFNSMIEWNFGPYHVLWRKCGAESVISSDGCGILARLFTNGFNMTLNSLYEIWPSLFWSK